MRGDTERDEVTLLGVRQGYDQWAGSYDDRDPTTTLDEPIVRPLCQSMRGRRVLDVACGTGRYSRLLVEGGAQVVGVDLSAAMLRRARAQLPSQAVSFVQAAADRLPFADGRFEAITCGLLLDHVEYPLSVLAEMARVVRPGGLVVVTTVHRDVQIFHHGQVPFQDGGVRYRIAGWMHEPRQILTMLQQAGLEAKATFEPVIDASFVQQHPAWRSRLGKRALLIMVAHRAPRLHLDRVRGLGAGGAVRKRKDAIMKAGRCINVGQLERMGSALLGSTLLARSFKRGRLLGPLMAMGGAVMLYRGLSGRCPMYRSMGVEPQDATVASSPLSRSIHARHSVTINASPEVIYRTLTDVHVLLRLIPQVQSIHQIEDQAYRWIVHINGRSVQLDLRVLEQRENELIRWASFGDSLAEHQGHVRLRPAPGALGCEVYVDMTYRRPLGVAGEIWSVVKGDSPRRALRETLRCLKQWIEARELPTSEGPSGRQGVMTPGTPSGEHVPIGQPRDRLIEGPQNVVDIASEDSFPASDAPGWTQRST